MEIYNSTHNKVHNNGAIGVGQSNFYHDVKNYLVMDRT